MTAVAARAARIGPCMATALFFALVAAILGAVPGWTMCFAAWVVFTWLVLGCIVLGSMVLAMAALAHRRWHALHARALRVLGLAVTMIAVVPLGYSSTLVSLAEARADLLAHADASAHSGGPRVAMTPALADLWSSDDTGFVYDPDHLLSHSLAPHEPARQDDAALLMLAQVVGDCINVSHLVGPYYRWRRDCDGQF